MLADLGLHWWSTFFSPFCLWDTEYCRGEKVKISTALKRETKQKLLKIHENLEAEVNALNTKIT